MRRLLEGLLARFPFDPRSRRALDETLGDWAHERATAMGAPQSFAIGVRGLLSLARVVVGCSIAEAARVPVAWLATAMAAALLVPAAILTAINYPWRIYGEQFSEPVVAGTFLMLTPMMVGFLAPASFFLLAVWNDGKGRVPAIGLALVAILFVVLWMAFVTPNANQRFRILVYEALTSARWEQNPQMARGLAEFTWPDLIRRAAGPPAHLPAFSMLALHLATGTAAATLVLLGAALSRRSLQTRILWSCGVFAFIVIGEPMLSLAARQAIGLRPALFASALVVWTTAAAALILALHLGGHTDAPTTSSSIPGRA